MSQRQILFWKRPDFTSWYSIEDDPFILGAGVYLVFNEFQVLYVGQSTNNISGRLDEAKAEIPDSEGDLFFTWANTSIFSLNGIEKFLIQHYDPPYNKAPLALINPIPVNLPWL